MLLFNHGEYGMLCTTSSVPAFWNRTSEAKKRMARMLQATSHKPQAASRKPQATSLRYTWYHFPAASTSYAAYIVQYLAPRCRISSANALRYRLRWNLALASGCWGTSGRWTLWFSLGAFLQSAVLLLLSSLFFVLLTRESPTRAKLMRWINLWW